MFKIWNDGDRGYKTHIEVDGEDVSDKFDSLVVRADLKEPVRIELGMPIDEYRQDDQCPKLLFPGKGARELLIKHGWTPPKDDA
jgi:hypothetical protein